MSDTRVIHPTHYNRHPSGLECWDVIGPMPFCIGNGIKYLWRAGYKHEAQCPSYVARLLEIYRTNPTPSIVQVFDGDLPCAHCRTLDHKKAANYIRQEAKRLAAGSTAAEVEFADVMSKLRPQIMQTVQGCMADVEYAGLVFLLQTLTLQRPLSLLESVAKSVEACYA